MEASYSLTLDKHGRLIIPAKVRKELKLHYGDTINLRVEAGKLLLTPKEVLLAELFEASKNLRESQDDVVTELLVERKAEANLEPSE